MGNSINNLLDNLLSLLWRVLDLPLYSIVLGVVILMATAYYLIKYFFKKDLKYFTAISILIILIFVIDKKFSNIRKEITFMNEKISDSMMTSNSNYTPIIKTKLYQIDSLKTAFPKSKIYDKTINEAIDLVSFKTSAPNVMAYISIIDLDYPNLKIKVSPEKKQKYLTSTFAKEHNCILAINGEAGLSMAMDCDLGEWTGNWISDGNVVLMKDTDKRPFIGFDKQSNAHYSIESKIDTVYNSDKYNAIWGRFDILIDGEVLTYFENDQPYARTVMGTNESGTLLYLMIVDGKRPDYSEGLTYQNCAKILKSLGAYNAMACDQGGSSCMYIEPLGGIINRPADSDGIERPIYSHFGISM